MTLKDYVYFQIGLAGNTDTTISDSVDTLIEAAINDLAMAGTITFDSSNVDSIVKEAIATFVKMNFVDLSTTAEREQFGKIYDNLKTRLTISRTYRAPEVEEI
jgi:hypothetical protein